MLRCDITLLLCKVPITHFKFVQRPLLQIRRGENRDRGRMTMYNGISPMPGSYSKFPRSMRFMMIGAMSLATWSLIIWAVAKAL
jgi:hypothetical protein